MGNLRLRDTSADTALALRSPASERVIEVGGQIDDEALCRPSRQPP